MTKTDFLSELEVRLSGLPGQDIKHWLEYYSEMIEDRIEDGMTEEQAIGELGSAQETAQKILSEIPLTKLIRERVKPRRALRAWETVLLILGSPIWLSLLIAAFAVVISVYIVLWSVILVLYAADLSVAAGGLVGVALSVIYIISGNVLSALLILGAGAICAGLSILMLLAFNQATRGMIALSRLILIGIKRCFIRKENAQ